MIGEFQEPRQLRYQRTSAAAWRILSTAGEAGRFEFKSTADAVSAKVLVAAANAVVLEGSPAGAVTVLVGVDEHEDARTGLVTGTVVGLGGDRTGLERSKEKIRSRASSIQPSPILLTIVEEAVSTSRPYLRLIVRPSAAPHYTEQGLRVTRYGASTRAITDGELLQMYLDREMASFLSRFKMATDSLEADIADVRASFLAAAADLERKLDGVDSSAMYAASEASESQSSVEWLDRYVRRSLPTDEDLQELFEAWTNFLLDELKPWRRAA